MAACSKCGAETHNLGRVCIRCLGRTLPRFTAEPLLCSWCGSQAANIYTRGRCWKCLRALRACGACAGSGKGPDLRDGSCPGCQGRGLVR